LAKNQNVPEKKYAKSPIRCVHDGSPSIAIYIAETTKSPNAKSPIAGDANKTVKNNTNGNSE